jgi:hypothetical protein
MGPHKWVLKVNGAPLGDLFAAYTWESHIVQALLKSFDVAFILIDAVDESNLRENLIDLLLTLATEDKFAKIQRLATILEYVDIKASFLNKSVLLLMSDSAMEKDIQQYIRVKLDILA